MTLTRHLLLQQGPLLQWAPLDKEHFLQHSLMHSYNTYTHTQLNTVGVYNIDV